MKIDKNNYEAYFLDYLEGNLDENLVNDFIEFIRQNPELKEELALFDSIALNPEDLKYEKKDALYKELYDNEEEFDHAAVASMEGDLSDGEKVRFDDYLSRHLDKQKEAQLFFLTKLKANESVIFNNKNKLLHNSTRKIVFLWASRVAALLILAMAIYTLINRQGEEVILNEQVAIIDNKTETNKTTRENAESLDENGRNTSANVVESRDTEPIKMNELVSLESTEISAEIVEQQPDNNLVATSRIPVEAPKKISNIEATFNNFNNDITLVSMNRYNQKIPEDRLEEQFLAEILKEKTGLDKLSLNKVTKAGLKLVSAISKDKFSYETNDNGKVTEVNFDTRLLAFSIPTVSSKNE